MIQIHSVRKSLTYLKSVFVWYGTYHSRILKVVTNEKEEAVGEVVTIIC